MTTDALFCSLTPVRVADLVRRAQYAGCYAAPGIQVDLAQAMVEAAGRFGSGHVANLGEHIRYEGALDVSAFQDAVAQVKLVPAVEQLAHRHAGLLRSLRGQKPSPGRAKLA